MMSYIKKKIHILNYLFFAKIEHVFYLQFDYVYHMKTIKTKH